MKTYLTALLLLLASIITALPAAAAVEIRVGGGGAPGVLLPG